MAIKIRGKMNKGKFCTIDGVKIWYKTAGKGMPVVFLHGWSVDHSIWENQFEKICWLQKRNFQRIYFDLPGMGKSITNHRIHNSDDMLAVISRFIDRMVQGKHFLLAGESYGGYLARGLLLTKEEQIDGLLLLCPLIFPGYRTGSHSEHIVLERDEKFMNSLSQEEKAGYQDLSVVQTKSTYRDYLRDIHVAVAKGNENFLKSELDGSCTEDINKNPFIFKKPALILTGRQDTEVGFRDQYDICKDFPRASLLIVDKAGHNLQIEQQKIFRTSVVEWLERVMQNNRELINKKYIK